MKAELIGVAACGLLGTAIAMAQQPQPQVGGGIEEIVVTAQRRAESIQEVPIAISAFTAEELELRNVGDTLDVVQYIPNLIGHNNTGLGSANAYFLRGLGTTESLATQDPPVGTYVDEIYISRQSANNLSFFNVERVEVLRGPQGTLFGRNTTGGAINVILKKPAETFGGFVEAGAGSHDRLSARASVDVPISERFLTNFSGFWSDDDGYVKNVVTGEDLNGEEWYGGRAAFSALFTDRFRWDLSAIHTYNFSANLVNTECNRLVPTDCDDRYSATGLRIRNGGQSQLAGLISGGLPYTVANGKGNLPLGAETKFTLISSNLQFDLGGATLNAITGYSETGQDYMIDFFDGGPAPTIAYATDPATGLPTAYNVANNINVTPAVRGFASGGFTIANIADSEQITQEIKLTGKLFGDRVDYVAGVFYYNEDNTTDYADVINVAGTPILLADRIVSNETTAYAGFAQFDYALTDQWKLTAGVRYTDENKDFEFYDNRPACRATPTPATCLQSENFASVDVDVNPATPPVEIPLSQETKLWTPRFAINYQPNEDLLFFASATRGFKSGSQSARATTVRSLLPFGPEKVWSYELGAKTEWLDRRLRLNVTAFYQDTEDFQGGTAFVNAQTGVLTFVTRNLASLENRGLEIELVALPIDRFTVSLAVGLQDIEYKLDGNAPVRDDFGGLSVTAQQAECRAGLAGAASPLGDTRTALARTQSACTSLVRFDGELADPVRAPDVTATLGLTYDVPIGAWDASIIPSVNVVYSSDQEVGTNNLSAFRNSAGVLNFARDGDFILGSYSEAHTVVNASLGFRTNDGNWFAAVGCDNCFDETYEQATLSNWSYLNAPATWSVKLRRSF